MPFVWPLLAVTLLLVGPLAIAYDLIGDRLMFNLLSADSMYYMGIANNFVKFGFPTFDGESITNAYQPLWQYLLIILFKLTAVPHHYQVYVVFLTSALLVYAAYLMTAVSFVVMLGNYRGLAATLMLFPGAYALLLQPQKTTFHDTGMFYYINPYTALNGMETPLSLALWALAILTFAIRRRALSGKEIHDLRLLFPLSTRLCLAAASLCRLEDTLIFVAIGIVILCQTKASWKDKTLLFAHIAWPVTLMLTAYLYFNWNSIGILLPTSGTKKMSYHWLDNLKEIWYLSWDVVETTWESYALRFFPLLCCVITGVICIYAGRKACDMRDAAERENYAFLLKIIGLFLVLKSLFLMLGVFAINQGYWYYFLIILLCNMVVAFWVSRRFDAHHYPWGFICLYAILLMFRLPGDLHLLTIDQKKGYSHLNYMLWQEGERIHAFLQKEAPGVQLIDSTDGSYAYMLDMPAQSCLGIVTSYATMQEEHKKGFWPTVILNGYALVPSGRCEDRNRENIQIIRKLSAGGEYSSFDLVALAPSHFNKEY